MTEDKDTQTDANDTETSGSIDTELTRGRSGFDLESTRRDLIAMRVKHGAYTPIGMRCSNLVELLQARDASDGERRAILGKNIGDQMADLRRLTSVNAEKRGIL